jgi:predicted acetyltransferase
VTVRPLTDADAPAVSRLSQLAFGWKAEELPDTLKDQTWLGLDGPDGLAGMVRLRHYEQWFTGRSVRMGGIAAVAVHPHARGQGTARQLMTAVVERMRSEDQPVSTLFPTAPGIYRPLGWEVVGTLDETPVRTVELRRAADPGRVTVRTAGPADVPAIARLYDQLARTGNGLMARTGPEFPAGAEGVLEHDLVALAELAGEPVGYLSYTRGKGYVDAEQRVEELVATRGDAAAALVRSLGSWDSVAPTTVWRGSTSDLALLLPSVLPPARRAQPWMLRINDAPAAVAARGWAADADVSFRLEDPQVPAQARGWRLVVQDGLGRLEPTEATGLPRLHVRGLALLYGGGSSAAAMRAGLLDALDPALDAAFGGQPARILDYF